MCKSPLYAVRNSYLVRDVRGEDLVLSNGRVRHYSQGEYVPEKSMHFVSFELWKELQADDEKGCMRFKQSVQGVVRQYFRIPCGQCMDCRLRYSKEWASRIACETATSRNCLFVTLTYSDEFLPLNEAGTASTLCYDHLRDYIKRLRELIYRRTGERDLRYYACGEYGSKSGRAHFHICFFNLPDFIISDLKPWGVSFDGDIYYVSQILTDVWSFGYVVCGELNYKSAAYVARYVCKKWKGTDSSVYKELGIANQESRMSLKPGIGYAYFDFFKDDLYKNDEMFLPSVGKVCLNKYFDRLYDIESPGDMETIKFNRQEKARRSLEYKLSQTDLDELSLLKCELDNLVARCKKLLRPLD